MTSSSAVSSLPASNAPVPDRSLVWRSTSTPTDQWIAFNLGSAQSVTAVAIANPKLHGTGGTLKVQRSADGATWSDVATLPAADTDTKVTFAFFNVVSAQYWRFYFTNTGSVSEYVEVGYPFAGIYFEPSNNCVAPMAAPLEDSSVVVKSITGQRTTTVRPQHSYGTFLWQSMSESDRGTLQQIFRTQGQGLPSFCVMASALSWTAWLFNFGNGNAGSAELGRSFTMVDQFYDVTLDWEEAL